jgi:hypothetical protein
MHVQFQKYFRGYNPGLLLKWGRGEMGREREEEARERKGKGSEGEVVGLATCRYVVPPLLA